MKLRTKFLLYTAILHVVTLVLSYFIFRENKVIFLISEVFILLSLVLSWSLYRQLIQPLKSLMTGLDAIRDKDFSVKFLKTGKYEVDQLIETYNRMIDQLRQERTLQEQQHFFLEKLINTSPTGIVILDFGDEIRQLNPRALELAGMEEVQLVGNHAGEVPGELFRCISQLKSGETLTIKHKGDRTLRLQKSHFVDRGFPRHFILIEELTAEILAAEKNAYGKVIRMMAHEVNNTIGPVNSIIGSALDHQALWENGTAGALRAALQVALDRNHNLNIFMRSFADLVKLPPPNPQRLDLHGLLGDIVILMKRQTRAGVQLNLEAEEQPFYISADPHLMEQALINVIKNAMEAISGEGSVVVRTYPTLRELTITDTGSGISPEAARQLFTPFFSTKRDGQGIGLTLVREILNSHGFRFSLKTEEDRLTVFRISF
jgi:two-component system, NtrC family, nitrogen regulation sensor histidine kinase NtrY